MLRYALVAVAAGSFALAGPQPAGSTEFPRGEAQATADTFSLNLKAANATIGFTYGRSIAGYQDRTGTAEARALDLGALPTLFGGVQCDGSPPLLNPATLPPLTRADSTVAGAEQSRRTQAFQPGLNGGPGGDPAGFQDATATPQPSSRAVTESVPADITLIAIDGGRTETSARLVGQVREAYAVTTAEQLRVFGGLFTFDKPRWEATARSGDQNGTTGSFTFERATVLGFPRTAADAMADLAGFKAGLEQLLAPLGVVLDLPRVVAREDGLKVTPMGFRVVNPPFGTDVLMPFLGQVDPLIQTLRQQAVASDCRNQTALTVVDVLLGVLGGSGAVEVLAGGVDVSTRATDYAIPATTEASSTTSDGAPPPEVSPDSLAAADTGTDFGSIDGGSADLGFAPLDAGGFTDASVPTGSGVPAVSGARRGPATASLPTASLNRFEDGTAGRAGVIVGIVSLLGAAAMSASDRVIGRRAKRRIP